VPTRRSRERRPAHLIVQEPVMTGHVPIAFDRPGWLLLLLLVVPAFLLTHRSIGGLSRGKAYFAFALRTIVIVLLSTALARPIWVKRGEGLTVTLVLDRTSSVPLALQSSALRFFEVASAPPQRERPEDRLAVITVGEDATIVGLPDVATALVPGRIVDPANLDATNLAAGLRAALAVASDDTANRIVVISDFNETEGSILSEAELARANGIPVDVMVLEYEHIGEVIFERLVAPAQARLGKTVELRMVLQTQAPASGRVSLKMNDEFIDLNGPEAGLTLPAELQPGRPNVIPVSVSLDEHGPVRFEASFEPDDPASDGILRNNRAMAVVFVGGQGKVLIVDDGTSESEPLRRALARGGVAADVRPAAALAAGPVFLAGYDAIVLANVPRFALTDAEDRTLHAYVHDLGAGLVMLGGPQSFGAGGWIESETAKALPVKLDPPQTRQMVRGALVLIMHSTEMPQGNYWGQKVAIAAIEALSSLDLVGIIDFGSTGTGWTFPLQEAGDKRAAVDAAKRMVMGDMPDFGTSMKQAHDKLVAASAGKKHVVIISDGDPAGPPKQLLDDYVAAGISVTTVLIAGHGTPVDRMMMKNIAAYTGGNFHEPKNPQQLPQIFIQEARVVSRSLIIEGQTFQPQVVTALPGPLKGFRNVPTVDGYVLTAPREGLSLIPIVNPTTEGDDPIYAYWNYGLGKAIAFTSDLTGRWGSAWAEWSDFQAFWEQSIRWAMRPATPSNVTVTTVHEGERAVVELEALEADASFMDFLRTSAVVLQPDGTTEALVLQQVGPGRYRGEFQTAADGAYLVNINFAGGSGGSRIEGNIQAAVSVPYPREFRAVKHDAALAHEVARRTGGRVLTGADPELAGLYDRESLEVPRSPRAVWDLMAIVAACLFVFDVAARRLAISRREMQQLAERALGRRREVGTETVAAWKRVASRRGREAPAPVSGSDAAGAVRFEAAAGDAGVAIDVEDETAPQGVPKAAQPARPRPGPPPGAEEGEYTSRLLAAKRRAIQERSAAAGESGAEGGPDA
jgi:uncharacterized membrane protein